MSDPEKLWTADDLVDWVKHHNTTDDPPLQVACWFVAYQQAMMIHESYTVKDYARVIQRGDRLGGPYVHISDIQEWLDDELAVFDNSVDDLMRNLYDSLKEFFKA